MWTSVQWGVGCNLVLLIGNEFAGTLYLNSILSQLGLRWVRCVFVFNRDLPPALLAEWQGAFYATAGRYTEIRVLTESWLWWRKFARCSCRESNPRPSDHESGAVPLGPNHAPVIWLLDTSRYVNQKSHMKANHKSSNSEYDAYSVLRTRHAFSAVERAGGIWSGTLHKGVS